ncbi:MAG: acetyl-CoA carboxylase biotin carboxylase subunit [Actinobacteria bacterium]|nr:acetyl-CoA carboxylase biotin carboxylase subunit [Actinomycetota bacterium]
MFDAVLVANRGEIATRVLRACRELGIRGVAVYSEADRDAPHVRHADEAYLLGPAPAAESYLNTPRVLDVARAAGVDAIHPGYGFLSENADFAEAVRDAGFTFVGPPAEAIRKMGDKLSAREAALAAEAPIVPGTTEAAEDPDEIIAFGSEHGYPLAIKAAFGGGGRGMKVVRSADEVSDALASARREAEAAFGRGECYVERYLERPRHVEIQVLADRHGNVIHLGERDCSLQRRHQKLVEEAPAPGVTEEVRQRMGAAATRIAREVGYHNAGTCEFLLDEDGETFYFLEMNTRLQVEHPVTEFVTGIDLVHAQLRVAFGEELWLAQDDIELRGHAIEVRLNAEEPAHGFVPSPGLIERFEPPQGPWVRMDAAAESGWEVPRAYDSLIGKLIVWGEDRDQARHRMSRALDELVIEGIPTTATFHVLAMQHEQFAAAAHCTNSVEHEWDLSPLQPQAPPTPGEGAPGPSREVTVEIDGRRLEVRVFGELASAPSAGGGELVRRTRATAEPKAHKGAASEDLVAPMQGTVVKYAVAEGDSVRAGDLVVVLEAMKMENHINAHRDGVVTTIHHEPGDVVESGAVLAHIEEGGAEGSA